MDYRIEKQQGFEVFLKREHERLTYWSKSDLNENQKRMISTYAKTKDGCSTGGLYRDISNYENIPEGFEACDFPEAMWAVFECKGNSRADAKDKTFNQITKEWFPQTNYELDSTYCVMVSYETPVDVVDDSDLGVYWVPIKEK